MQFRNEYYFLSNMYPCSIELFGVQYSCAEAAFQSFKVPLCKRNMFIGKNGYEAKRLGRLVKLPSNWDAVRTEAMMTVVREKFMQNPDLKQKLLATENEYIQEDNVWNDKFWGVCDGEGYNMLGKILMDVREGLKDV